MSTTTATTLVLAALAGAAAQTCPLADEFGYAFPNGAEDAASTKARAGGRVAQRRV